MEVSSLQVTIPYHVQFNYLYRSEQLGIMPAVDPSTVLSLIIKGDASAQPVGGAVLLDRIVLLTEFYKEVGNSTYLMTTDFGLGKVGDGLIRLSDAPFSLINSKCGWDQTQFRVAHIDAFTSEYELIELLPATAIGPSFGKCGSLDSSSFVYGYSFTYSRAGVRTPTVYSFLSPDAVGD